MWVSIADKYVFKFEVIMDVTQFMHSSKTLYYLNCDKVASWFAEETTWTLFQQLAQTWSKCFHKYLSTVIVLFWTKELWKADVLFHHLIWLHSLWLYTPKHIDLFLEAFKVFVIIDFEDCIFSSMLVILRLYNFTVENTSLRRLLFFAVYLNVLVKSVDLRLHYFNF